MQQEIRPSPARRRKSAWAVAAGLIAALGSAAAFALDELDEPPIQYMSSTPVNAITRLQAQLDAGKVKLTYDPVRGWLPGLLTRLGVPVSSQSLVFSKTSFQRDFISPQTPRAVYFNDDLYIGWVQSGEYLEISVADPKLGAVFYTLPQHWTEKPKFTRQTHECLACHESSMTRGIPGHMVRSVYADATGQPLFSAGSRVTTDESPLEERWGGWYVTGSHGAQRHMGNLITHSVAQAETANLNAGANLTDLSRRFDISPYLGKQSDVVALMVLGHQTTVHNLITRLSYEARRAVHFQESLDRELGRPVAGPSESTLRRIKSVGEPLVRALLFSKETRLTAPVKGTSTFTAEFARSGPRDPKGRSLRDLDLKTRLFRYPCSFLIYSEAFRELPPLAKQYVFTRLEEVLSGSDTTPEFVHLTPADRHAIREILRATLPEFAAAGATPITG